jgi:Family of unknown function (DUF6230)
MYSKKLFAKSMGASISILVIIVLVILSSGTAYALPVAGVGGFTIQADKITASDQILYPGVEDTSEQKAYPVAVVEQKNTRITNMVLTKQLPVDEVPLLEGNARIVISSKKDKVRIDEQILKASSIQAENATFGGQMIDDHPKGYDDSFAIRNGPNVQAKGKIVNVSGSQPAVVLKDAKIQAHYLATSQISLPGLQIDAQYDPDGDGTYEHKVTGDDGSKDNSSDSGNDS